MLRLTCFFFILSFLFLLGCGVPAANASIEHAAAAMETGLMRSVSYYISENGLLIPVERSIPLQLNDVAAALNLLVSSDANDELLRKMHLSPALSQGTAFTVKLLGETAEIDVQSLGKLPNAAAEQRAVTAILATALSFKKVAAAELTFDGISRDTLLHGTPVSETFTRADVNAEPSSITAEKNTFPLTLWYIDSEYARFVPVTRMVTAPPTAVTAVEELIRGTQFPLDSLFPAGLTLVSLAETDGCVTMQFSPDIRTLALEPTRMELALCSLCRTLEVFVPLRKAVVCVNGETIAFADWPI